jgi:hypothetical protein
MHADLFALYGLLFTVGVMVGGPALLRAVHWLCTRVWP